MYVQPGAGGSGGDVGGGIGAVGGAGDAGGGVGVAGGVTLLVLAPSSRKEGAAKKAGVQPYLGLGEIGAVGRF